MLLGKLPARADATWVEFTSQEVRSVLGEGVARTLKLGWCSPRRAKGTDGSSE